MMKTFQQETKEEEETKEEAFQQETQAETKKEAQVTGFLYPHSPEGLELMTGLEREAELRKLGVDYDDEGRIKSDRGSEKYWALGSKNAETVLRRAIIKKNVDIISRLKEVFTLSCPGYEGFLEVRQTAQGEFSCKSTVKLDNMKDAERYILALVPQDKIDQALSEEAKPNPIKPEQQLHPGSTAHINYTDKDGNETSRRIEVTSAKKGLTTAFCHKRQEFRTFRNDRINNTAQQV